MLDAGIQGAIAGALGFGPLELSAMTMIWKMVVDHASVDQAFIEGISVLAFSAAFEIGTGLVEETGYALSGSGSAGEAGAGAVEEGASAAEDDAARSLEEADNGIPEGAVCPNSFSADTPVATENGEQPISEIKVGDKVLAYDEQTGETRQKEVTAVHVHTDAIIVHLTIDNETIDTTPEHPFYTQERGWVYAGDLQVGEHIRREDGSYGEVKGLRAEQHAQTMYNLTVDEAHTFFVGEGQWLVHNSRCTIDSPKPDWAQKGAHIKVDIGGRKPIEIVLRPGEGGEILFKPFFSNNTQTEIDAAVRIAQGTFQTDRNFVEKVYSEVSKGVGFVLQFPNDGGEGRSAELNFLKKALEQLLNNWE